MLHMSSNKWQLAKICAVFIYIAHTESYTKTNLKIPKCYLHSFMFHVSSAIMLHMQLNTSSYDVSSVVRLECDSLSLFVSQIQYIFQCFGTVTHFSTCNFYNANIKFSLYSLKNYIV